MDTNVNIFEQASRKSLRFASVQGELTTEDLWTLPLSTKASNRASLDNVAITVFNALKNVTSVSFVSTTANPAKAELELKLEIVKYVIAVRQAEAAAKATAEERAAKRRHLTELLDRKQQAAMEGLSEEQIRAQLLELAD